MKIWKSALVAALAFFSQKTGAQEGYEITVRLDGMDTGMVSLGYFFGHEQYLADSVRVDAATSSATFRGPDRLAEGMYFMAGRAGKLLDFMVDSVQFFTLKGRYAAPDSMDVEGPSEENRAFFAHKKAAFPLLAALANGQANYELLRKATNDPAVLKEHREKINAIYRQLNQLTIGHINENPDRLYSKMLRMGFNPDPPADVPVKKDGRINPDYLAFLKAHYFDNVDFADGRLLYCNVFADRLTAFMRDYFPQTAEGQIEACDLILAKTAAHDAFNVWAVVNLTRRFENPDWQPGATVFTHLVDKYQQPDQQPWLDHATQLRLQYKADVWRPCLLGKTAPPLRLFDENQMLFDLATVDAPLTMLVFFSPLCEHCQKELPEVLRLHKEFSQKGLKTVAVSTEADREMWLDFIKKQGLDWVNLIETAEKSQVEKDYAAFDLPVIYLLDREKKIVGRRVKTSELGAMLANLMK